MEYLASLNNKSSKIEGPLKRSVASQKELTRKINENADNKFQMIDEHKYKVFNNVLNLLELILKDLMNLKSLYIYGDFITLFVEELETKLSYKTWINVRKAIHQKIELKI